MNKYSHRDGLSKVSSYRQLIAKSKGLSAVNPREPYLNPKQIPEENSESLKKFHKKTCSLDATVNEKVSFISPYTIAQNELVSESLHKIQEDKQLQHWFPDIKSSSMLRSDHDFKKIISKLNQVIYPDLNKRSLFLNEDEPVEFCLEEGQTQFCKTYVKGKKAPLIMKILRFRGKIFTYLSFTNKEPGPTNYDRFCTSDYFEVREKSQEFKYNYIYFALKASEYSEFKVTVSFGKISDMNEIKKIKRQLSQLHLGSIFEQSPIEERSQKKEKDFILMNKSIKFLNSNLKKPELKKRAENWEAKHSLALVKKKTALEKRINKFQGILDKQVNKRNKLKEISEVKVQTDLKKSYEKTWLRVIYFAVSLNEIRFKIRQNRENKLKSVTQNLQAIKIQKFYKRFRGDLGVTDKVLIRAKNNLLLFRGSAIRVAEKEVCFSVFRFVSCVLHNKTSRPQLNQKLLVLLFKSNKPL